MTITSGVFTVLLISFRFFLKKQLTLSPCFTPEQQQHGILAPVCGILTPLLWEQKAYEGVLLPAYLNPFRDCSLAVADEEFSPCYKLRFLHSPCQRLLMHLKQQTLPPPASPRCAEAACRTGVWPQVRAGGIIHLIPTAAVKIFFGRDSKIFITIVMHFPSINSPPLTPSPLRYKAAQQNVSAPTASHLPWVLLGYTSCRQTGHSARTSAYSLYCLYLTAGAEGKGGGGTWLGLASAMGRVEGSWARFCCPYLAQTNRKQGSNPILT